MLQQLLRSLSSVSLVKPNFIPLFSAPVIFKRTDENTIKPSFNKHNFNYAITVSFERTQLKLFNKEEFIFDMGETSGLYVGNVKGHYYESSFDFGSTLVIKPLSIEFLPYNDRRYQRRTNEVDIAFSKNQVFITLTDESGKKEQFSDKIKQVDIQYTVK